MYRFGMIPYLVSENDKRVILTVLREGYLDQVTEIGRFIILRCVAPKRYLVDEVMGYNPHPLAQSVSLGV